MNSDSSHSGQHTSDCTHVPAWSEKKRARTELINTTPYTPDSRVLRAQDYGGTTDGGYGGTTDGG